MGIIVQFPQGGRSMSSGRCADANPESASVIILPVVRIERHAEPPFDGLDGGNGAAPNSGRRRRSSRS